MEARFWHLHLLHPSQLVWRHLHLLRDLLSLRRFPQTATHALISIVRPVPFVQSFHNPDELWNRTTVLPAATSMRASSEAVDDFLDSTPTCNGRTQREARPFVADVEGVVSGSCPPGFPGNLRRPLSQSGGTASFPDILRVGKLMYRGIRWINFAILQVSGKSGSIVNRAHECEGRAVQWVTFACKNRTHTEIIITPPQTTDQALLTYAA